MTGGPHWLDVERERQRKREEAITESRDEWRRLYDKADVAIGELTAKLSAEKSMRQAGDTRVAELEAHLSIAQGGLSDRNAYVAQLEETNARQLRELAALDAEIARLRGTL